MKGLACGLCYDLRALPNTSPLREVISCRCGNVQARWDDPQRGTAVFAARDRTTALGVGFNNAFLVPALSGKLLMHADARRYHEIATTAPGYVFDESKAGCWAVVYRPGSTTDTRFVDLSELELA